MSCTASESMNNVDERADERREYYRALDSIDAHVLMLERQSKTHRLGKNVREEVRSLADTVFDAVEQNDSTLQRIRNLEAMTENCAQQNKDILQALFDLRVDFQEMRSDVEVIGQVQRERQQNANQSREQESAAFDDAPGGNCFTEPFVALWRSVVRRKQRTSYSRFERGELDTEQRVMVDDNEFCVTTQFSKTE